MTLVWVIVWFGIAVAVVGFVCSKVPRKLEPVTFRDTAPQHAGVLVAQFAEGTFENRFGFPTGFFHVDEKKTKEPERYVFKEAQPIGTVTDGCAVNIGSMGAAGLGEGLYGCLWMLVVGCMAAPFVLISTVDRLYRAMMRSRVQIDVRKAGADCVVTVAFYGISGYLLLSRYALAFATPKLPEGLAAPETVTAAGVN